jgi:uncharacterized RDD family membrane protein YckC
MGVRVCKRCGANIPAGQSLLAEAGFAGDGEVAPASAGSGPTPARIMRGTHRLATIGDRLLASILDCILLFAVFMVASFWAAARWGGLSEAGLMLGGKPFLVALLLILPFAFLYFWLLECLPGATLGKLIMGLQVRTESGARLDLRTSAIRNAWRAVDGLMFYLVGFLVSIFSRMRQRIGDHLSHSVVLETPASEWRQGVMVLVWLLALLGATLVSGKIYNATAIAPQSANPPRAMMRMNWSGGGVSLKALGLQFSLHWGGDPVPTQQAYQPEQPKQ